MIDFQLANPFLVISVNQSYLHSISFILLTDAWDIWVSHSFYFLLRISFSRQIDDVEIAEYHGTADCEVKLDQPLPVEYRVPTSDEPGHYIGLHAFGLIVCFINAHSQNCIL